MPSILSLSAALLAGVSLSAAAPATNHQSSKHGFSVKQVQSSKAVRSLALQKMKTHAKYGITPPHALVQAAKAAKARQGSVPADPEAYDGEYTCPVTIGQSTVNLQFDTGSSTLWTMSTEEPSSETSGHKIYSPSNSGSRLDGYTFNATYVTGDGGLGDVWSDKVVIGGVTATSQAVGVATYVSDNIVQDTQLDGLLGLGFAEGDTIRPSGQPLWFDQVKSSLPAALFTADLKHATAGSFDFGYIDSSKYTGQITYVDAASLYGSWSISGGSYSKGSDPPQSSFGTTLIDTGSLLIYLPQSLVEDYYSGVSGVQYSDADAGYIYDCSAQLPNINLQFGGSVFTVSGRSLYYAPSQNDQSKCVGTIQTVLDDRVIIGTEFFHQNFVVFDQSQGSPRIGFAKKSG